MTLDTTARRRQQAPDTVARRAEQALMTPFRRQIGQLQSDVALLLGRANASKSGERAVLEDDRRRLLLRVDQVADAIELALPGPGYGPAGDCRRALEAIRQRVLAATP